MRFNAAALALPDTNAAGAAAVRLDPKMELATTVLCSFLKDSYYESGSAGIDRLNELVTKTGDCRFAAKLAIHARHEHGMRSVTHVIAALIAKAVKGEQWTAKFFDRVVRRPDDMLEILAYYQKTFGDKKLPNAIKRGFAKALARFDAYQLAKYRGEGKSLKLVDVANLCHPKHTDALGKLMKGELKNTDTWEAKLSAAGDGDTEDDVATNKANAWKDLISERKLGYFALLRNLRNISKQAPDQLHAALAQLVDPVAVSKSLVLPFRFTKAIEQFEGETGSQVQAIRMALSRALDLSCANVPEFPGRTLIAVDHSGSMSGEPLAHAALFGAVLLRRNPSADLMTFTESAQYMALNPADSTQTNILNILGAPGGGTNFNSIFIEAARLKRAYDRVIILSDMQAWMDNEDLQGCVRHYEKIGSCKPLIYSWDVKGLGTIMFPVERVICMAGFSDRCFSIMKTLEGDRSALVSAINAVEL